MSDVRTTPNKSRYFQITEDVVANDLGRPGRVRRDRTAITDRGLRNAVDEGTSLLRITDHCGFNVRARVRREDIVPDRRVSKENVSDLLVTTENVSDLPVTIENVFDLPVTIENVCVLLVTTGNVHGHLVVMIEIAIIAEYRRRNTFPDQGEEVHILGGKVRKYIFWVAR